MILRALKYFIFFIVLVITSSYSIYDVNQRDTILLQFIMNALKQAHYEDIKIDDSFSERVYNQYIKSLDYNKRFFLQSDIEKLEQYKFKIDDEISNGSFDFYKTANEIFNMRFKSVSNYYKRILNNPFDYTTNETIETKPEKIKYSKDTIELFNTWTKLLKFQTLAYLVNIVERQEKAIEKKDTTVKIKSFDSLEFEARKKIQKNFDEFINSMNKLNDNDRYEMFMNSITSVYDPHTEYYSPFNKEDFDINMSGQLEGIGATLTSRGDGYIRVTEIVPGSPSWLQGDLKAGDIILKVAQGSAEPVDVVDMRLDKAVRLIRGKKGTEVRLTVKKVDGSIVIISIIRDVVVIKETYAKSAVITTKENNDKIGYIYLPKFYVDFNSSSGRQCSEDVKKEINKLKKENVKGIIFDIRNNGGGSLQDVVKMAGYFIKKGPIVQVNSRLEQPLILSDTDPSVEYDGPLVIMVNESSASASEILAAAMQDYKRAVIVGSTTTFGKGSVQQIYDIDQNMPVSFDSYKPFGAIKITVKKFYRINGGSTQLKGVSSDIVLPDIYSYIDVGEREQDNCMKWTEISPVSYNIWEGLQPDINKIKEIENERVKNNKYFKLIEDNAKIIKEQRDKTVYSLNLKTYREEQDKNDKISNKLDDLDKMDDLFNITALTDNTDNEKLNEENSKITEKWIKSLKKDIYLNESVEIIKNIGKLNQKK